MAEYFLASVASAGKAAAAVVVEGTVHEVAGRPTMADLLADWRESLHAIESAIEHGRLEPGRPVGDVRLLPPVPQPPNLYMIGANYADHAREMRGLSPDAPVPKPAGGPFVFLKPTTTLVGHGDPVRLPPGSEKVDWEAELAVVIGHRAANVAPEHALAFVAGYTIANDVSVRDRFRRPDSAEPPMTFDWFAQKGWETSCPMGPWLAPAHDRSEPAGRALRLTLNGTVEQDSSTSEMIFSVAEQIAYISAIVPLVPGDVICTGTPAGVGMAKGRFLSAGDEVVCEIEGIGRLANPVVADG
jgi:2-keto-4-pentenoate hydratase/2-oxohepta-3-ene-1,7-dioic acid hydratase in catechol pathway